MKHFEVLKKWCKKIENEIFDSFPLIVSHYNKLVHVLTKTGIFIVMNVSLSNPTDSSGANIYVFFP